MVEKKKPIKQKQPSEKKEDRMDKLHEANQRFRDRQEDSPQPSRLVRNSRSKHSSRILSESEGNDDFSSILGLSPRQLRRENDEES